VHVLVMIAS